MRAVGLIAAIAACVAVASPAASQAAASAQTVGPAGMARALRLEMGLVRLPASMSFTGFWLATTPSFRQASIILAPRSPDEARLWTDFFAHAVEVSQISGDKAVTGWRDPLTDVWLLGDWTRDGDAWRLDHLTMALTQALDGQSPPGGPLQPAYPGMQDGGLAKALVSSELQAVTVFRRAAATPGAINWDPAAPSAVRARTVALLRLGAAEDSLAAMASVVPDSTHVLRVALVEETPMAPGVSPTVADKLHARSVETRLSLAPIQYLPGKGETLAIVQSALEPQWLFVTHLAPTGAAGGAKVVNVEAIDLSKAEPAQ
jgi:hypothetical protein